MKKKKCPKCGVEKSVDKFYRYKRKKDGLRCYCKKCVDKSRKEYDVKNKEKYKAKWKAKYQKRKPYMRNYMLKQKFGKTGIAIEKPTLEDIMFFMTSSNGGGDV